MNKAIQYPIAACVALFMALTAHAQDNRQATYEQSIDYVKCKCTEIIYNISLNCERDPATSRVEQYASRHPRTGTLMGELERLKRTQVETWTTDSIAQFLGAYIFHSDNRSTYPQSYSFSTNRSRNTDGTLNTLSTAVVQYVQNRIPDLPTAADLAIIQDSLVEAELPPALIPDDGILMEDRDTTEDARQNQSFFSFHLNIAHVLLAALAVLISWILINRMKREHQDQINDLKFRLDGKAETSELMKVENEIIHFTEKLEAARRKRLAEKQSDTGQRMAMSGKGIESRPLSVEKVLYLPAPREDGTFDTADESTTFQPAASIYKFKIDPANPNLATFSFHSDNLGLQHAIGNPATYIRPVCRESNPIHPGAKYLATVKPGVATRKDDRWVVGDDQKALVRYE